MEASDEIRAAAFEAAVAALNAGEYRYAVQRGHPTWPDVAGDLDILVSPRGSESIINCIQGAFGDMGLDVVVVCRHVDVPVVFGARRADPAMFVEIDVASNTQWAAGSFLNVGGVLARRVFSEPLWIVSPADESALLGVPSLLGTDVVRDSKGSQRLARVQQLVATDPMAALSSWSEAVGEQLAAKTLAAIRAGDHRTLSIVARRAKAIRYVRSAMMNPRALFERAYFLAYRRRRDSRCGLWSHGLRRLEPIREVDRSPEEWLLRLDRIRAMH